MALSRIPDAPTIPTLESRCSFLPSLHHHRLDHAISSSLHSLHSLHSPSLRSLPIPVSPQQTAFRHVRIAYILYLGSFFFLFSLPRFPGSSWMCIVHGGLDSCIVYSTLRNFQPFPAYNEKFFMKRFCFFFYKITILSFL